ncbi:MAG: Type II secretion system protein E (GspE) [Candidatus Nomurabacteria bacterium GW2011_GWA2_43_15]|uniref:Type II secretion system protein E (GspE) n=4 Tax=Candidatus Nomuraibacteriota TaxID=1752729 RepID=A0A0G1DSQ8_9BACT|nr:MAG: Type II secretion system protein E (GspE) [Candidatus Nomurabacteria bacterium GW2011_GWA2_43_15]KKT19783.1 MAG: Type II secretion system protein E (GspE) [Candidatus Nomurabacteria bacterium GW2011_GWB1_43_7]
MKEMTIKKKSDKVEEELARGADVSIINLIDQLIEKADASRASDIHIDPLIEGVRIRFRIDGVLQDAYLFPKEINNEIISRIKILSKLRSDEHQMTQDGRFRYVLPGENKFIDFRVSIVPTYHGENAVLRLLTDKNEESTLEDLGFSESDRKKIENAIRKTNGMILSTGPTGSGKTTTMYTLIKMLNSPGVSIITIEDPIEYAIDEVEQIQVNSRFGLTFANGLRSILRQDPNIIMVGEIRDAETASIAVNTALTGHLLLSTLHTNDAATTLPRLLDMGIEEYLVASTVSIAIGQRLVRKICKDCKEKKPMTHGMKEALAQTPYASLLANNDFVYKGKGCEECGGSGYRGRICINEVLVADNEIKEAILRRASANEIKKIAVKNGMTTMFEDGFQKVKNGLTTIEEVLRVIHE